MKIKDIYLELSCGFFFTQGFSSFLYSFFRDENGQSRGRENTITDVTYTDWQTRTGTINHTVSMLITPAILVSTST